MKRKRDPSPRLLNGPAAAAHLGVPYTTLLTRTHRGLVRVIRPGGSRRMWFDKADLEEFVERWKEQLD